MGYVSKREGRTRDSSKRERRVRDISKWREGEGKSEDIS